MPALVNRRQPFWMGWNKACIGYRRNSAAKLSPMHGLGKGMKSRSVPIGGQALERLAGPGTAAAAGENRTRVTGAEVFASQAMSCSFSAR